MSKSGCQYRHGDDVLHECREALLRGEKRIRYNVGDGDLGKFELAPGEVTVLAARPGAGKTAWALQVVATALSNTPELKAIVCNVEMSPSVLLERLISCVSGVALTQIRDRELTEDQLGRIDTAVESLDDIAARIAFVQAPYSLRHVADVADDFGGTLFVLDYIQRILPPDNHDTTRARVDSMMSAIRRFADNGGAVVAVSAVSRSKDSKGRSSYAGADVGLASFKESGELEYGADNAWLLLPNDNDTASEVVVLKHLKSRYGELHDISLRFNRRIQRFETLELSGSGSRLHVNDSLRAIWGAAKPAPEGR